MTDEELLIRYRKGDKSAKGELIQKYLPLIKSQVNLRFGSGTSIPSGAIESEGILQVSKAIDTYDPTKGASLSTHIYNYLHKMSRFVNTFGHTVRHSEEVFSMISPIKEAQNKLREKLGREPNLVELSDEAKLPEHTVKRVLPQIMNVQLELDDSPGSKSVSSTIDDYIEYTRKFKFTPQETFVFDHSTGFDGAPKKKAGDIAKELKVSPAQISHIKNSISGKIKNIFDEADLYKE